MLIRLTWQDPTTHETQQQDLETPVAIGKSAELLPKFIQGQPVSQFVLLDDQIADYHALIEENNQELIITDQQTETGTLINGIRLPSSSITSNDLIKIGSYQIQIHLKPANEDKTQGCNRMIGFLFKRRCGRLDPTGCPYCQGEQTAQNQDFAEYAYYPNYGRYNDWGYNYYLHRHEYSYNRETGNVDFTEADAAALESELDTDYEQDMGAS